MFWVLDRPDDLSKDSLYATISGKNGELTWSTLICSVCGRVRVVEQINDLVVELHGSIVFDFIWSDDPAILISNRLMKQLKESKLKGFAFRPVNVKHWWRKERDSGDIVDTLEMNPPPEIHQLVVEGRGGSINPQNQVQIRSKCDECGVIVHEPLESGVSIDPNQWDKTDLFILDEFPGYVFATDEVKVFLELNQISGYQIIPAEEYSM